LSSWTASTTPTPVFREEWLDAALELLKPWIHKQYTSPGFAHSVALSVGFPPGSRGPSNNGTIITAVCFAPSETEDGRCAIFINPAINDSYDVVGNLVHEYGHAVVGHDEGHRKNGLFSIYCKDVDLLPPLTRTIPGPRLRKKIQEVIAQIGTYEAIHAKIDLSTRVKQETYQLKGSCR